MATHYCPCMPLLPLAQQQLAWRCLVKNLQCTQCMSCLNTLLYCRPLLPVTWPELVRHYLEDNQSGPPFEEAREALDALRQSDYSTLSAAHRLKLLESLIHAVADTEIVRK